MFIVSKIENNAGFYSMFFNMLNHYIYAIRNNYGFGIDSSSWMFKYKDGWTDYFLNVEIPCNTFFDSFTTNCRNIIYEYPLYEYKNIIRNIYQYNDNMKNKIAEKMRELNLVPGEYDAIFIRRGDKLCDESMFFPTRKYFQMLLEKNPNCKTIFLQTDDYNAYLDIQRFIKEDNLNIRVITLCSPDCNGMVIFDNITPTDIDNASRKNKHNVNLEYLSQISDQLKKEKPVNTMNSDEIYEHTLTLLIGVDIVLNSNICVCEYFSNVSRFIKFMHNNYENVYDIYRSNTEIDLNTMKSPAFLCSFYPGL
jgi:hypothetical protein